MLKDSLAPVSACSHASSTRMSSTIDRFSSCPVCVCVRVCCSWRTLFLRGRTGFWITGEAHFPQRQQKLSLGALSNVSSQKHTDYMRRQSSSAEMQFYGVFWRNNCVGRTALIARLCLLCIWLLGTYLQPTNGWVCDCWRICNRCSEQFFLGTERSLWSKLICLHSCFDRTGWKKETNPPCLTLPIMHSFPDTTVILLPTCHNLRTICCIPFFTALRFYFIALIMALSDLAILTYFHIPQHSKSKFSLLNISLTHTTW